MAYGPDELHHLIERIQSVRNSATDDKGAVTRLYASVSPDHDARITAFAKFRTPDPC
jgi:hypothetical protein